MGRRTFEYEPDESVDRRWWGGMPRGEGGHEQGRAKGQSFGGVLPRIPENREGRKERRPWKGEHDGSHDGSPRIFDRGHVGTR